ncbi:MAG TPA: YggS family pyridoxal phosphate-dependent enzyme [Acidobacteria bacterium]|nr:YggS family pyridoxal phosphate-dependent enzyme [Acidobacteriota bacterium]
MASSHERVAGSGHLGAPASLSSHHPIARNLCDIRHRVSVAARAAGRNPDDVRLIAVSKTFGIDQVRMAANAGQTEFGENRVQEALRKCDEGGGLDLRWHLIGHLQTNKVRKVVQPFAWIHSVDRIDLLQRLEQAATEQGTRLSLLIQVDLAGETTKHGLPPSHLPRILDAAAGCQAVRVRGLMLLPPFEEDPEQTRPYFRQLRELRDEVAASGVDRTMLQELSMGMSHDFETAIAEGATMVRVGTAIFGTRTAPASTV